MEIIGIYKVRKIQDECLIHAPPGAIGKWVIEKNDDNSFTYRPSSDGSISAESLTRWEVWDYVHTENLPVSFDNEKLAIRHKEKMERTHKRQFRMRKVFSSSGNGSIVEYGDWL